MLPYIGVRKNILCCSRLGISRDTSAIKNMVTGNKNSILEFNITQ